MKLSVVDEAPERRNIWDVNAVSEMGRAIVAEARRLAFRREYAGFTDRELVRKAFINLYRSST